MSEGRNSNPSLLPHVVAAVLTVSATWTAIRTEVPSMVEAEMSAQMATYGRAMQEYQDSLYQVANAQLHALVASEASAVRDSLLGTLQLVTQRPGHVTYSPNITVQADTLGMHRLEAKLDSSAQLQRRILRELQQVPEPQPKSRAKRQGTPAW